MKDYRDLRRVAHREGVGTLELGMYLTLHGITFHSLTKLLDKSRPFVTTPLRVLKACNPDMINQQPIVSSYNVGRVEKHRLDELCVVIPSLTDYIGAFRFIPTDDVLTVPGSRMSYFRCPDVTVAVCLSLWLQSPLTIEAIRTEFAKHKRMKTMTLDFLQVIPMAEGVLHPDIVAKAIELDTRIKKLVSRANEKYAELNALAGEYTVQ